ncbi:hypothetical protein ADK53_28020 [Streptomyces sp. WM6373]|nr:hypothetical protein ADK53_28020 [Streptomyces sp. WM6373]KOU62446.1 hypothetical protein ADK96_26585 [Streptomyces sp. IGB124]KOV18732.1 hypothetical protein ADK90_19970 [Streptomyces sp. XY413]
MGAGAPVTNDLYHGGQWTIDLNHLSAEARADLSSGSAGTDSIHGIPPTDRCDALTCRMDLQGAS